MLNIKQLRISTILVALTFILTACAGQHIKEMPTDLSSEIDQLAGKGFNFGHLVIMDANTGKHKLLKRSEKDESGNQKYETKHISGPQSISGVKSVSSYSVYGVKVEDKQYSFCNIVNINGTTELICKKTDISAPEAHDEGGILKKSLEKLPILPQLLTLPGRVVDRLEKLGGETVNDIGFIIVHDIHGQEAKLLKSEGYETADISLLDSAKELSLKGNSTMIKFKDNPCCKWETDGHGTRTRTCDRFASSC